MGGFLDRATEVAKQAGDMAKRGVGEAKVRGQELTLNRKFNSLAEELGQIVFRQREGEGGLIAWWPRCVAFRPRSRASATTSGGPGRARAVSAGASPRRYRPWTSQRTLPSSSV
jgi:hypothetical protein